MKQRPDRKYSLGLRSMFGACSGVSSQCSSSRSSQNGSQPVFASRNATRSFGKRCRMPPTVNAITAIIWPTGCVKACTSRRVDQRSTPTGTWSMAWPPPCTHTATPSSSAVRHTTSKRRVVEVLLAHVLRGHHADHAVLRDAAPQLRHRGLGVDHRQLGDRHQPLRVVAQELGPAVVQRPAERVRELAVESRPLLAGAAREHDRLVDALEVHVLEARLRVGHAGAVEAVELRLALGLLDAHARQVGEVLS